MKQTLTPSKINRSHFILYDGILMAEISDLEKEFRFSRIYEDSNDEGFTIVSREKQQEVVFALSKTERDREGVVTNWDFLSVTPGFKGLTARIFNDRPGRKK